MARKHQMDEVLRALSKKKDCKVYNNSKMIIVLNGLSYLPKFQLSNDLGNGTWGKIDYLCNHCGYRYMYQAEFPNGI